jgi:hypothetical protein
MKSFARLALSARGGKQSARRGAQLASDGPLPEIMDIFRRRETGVPFQSGVAKVKGRCHDGSSATRYFTKA